MARQVILLRGVNVGGRTLSMAALRDALTTAGCRDVTTYIQSGNVVIEPPTPRPRDLQRWLEGVVSEVAGYDVSLVLRTRKELGATVAANPYPTVGGTGLHVVFFAVAPPALLVSDLELETFAPDHCTLVGRDLYLNLPNGMGRAKLPIVLDQAGRRLRPPVVGTARNWNTVLKLVELASA